MIVDMHVAPTWEYIPVAPYRIVAVSLSTSPNRPMPYVNYRPTIDGAVKLFECLRSPLPDRSVVLSDTNDVTLLSHNTSDRFHLRWIGVAAGFDALREHTTVPPLEVDLAEIEAHAAWSTPDD